MKIRNPMTGKDKKMNYPETYIIRIDRRLKKILKKVGAKKVREQLEKISS
jgi:hypothetical protein